MPVAVQLERPVVNHVIAPKPTGSNPAAIRGQRRGAGWLRSRAQTISDGYDTHSCFRRRQRVGLPGVVLRRALIFILPSFIWCYAAAAETEEVAGHAGRIEDRRQSGDQRRAAGNYCRAEGRCVHLRVPPDNLRLEVTRGSIVSVTTPDDVATSRFWCHSEPRSCSGVRNLQLSQVAVSARCEKQVPRACGPLGMTWVLEKEIFLQVWSWLFMNKDLGWKLIVIVAVVLIFGYGIFGVPAGSFRWGACRRAADGRCIAIASIWGSI